MMMNIIIKNIKHERNKKREISVQEKTKTIIIQKEI